MTRVRCDRGLDFDVRHMTSFNVSTRLDVVFLVIVFGSPNSSLSSVTSRKPYSNNLLLELDATEASTRCLTHDVFHCGDEVCGHPPYLLRLDFRFRHSRLSHFVFHSFDEIRHLRIHCDLLWIDLRVCHHRQFCHSRLSLTVGPSAVKQTNKLTNKQANKQTNKQTNRPLGCQTNKQTN